MKLVKKYQGCGVRSSVIFGALELRVGSSCNFRDFELGVERKIRMWNGSWEFDGFWDLDVGSWESDSLTILETGSWESNEKSFAFTSLITTIMMCQISVSELFHCILNRHFSFTFKLSYFEYIYIYIYTCNKDTNAILRHSFRVAFSLYCA